MHGATPGQGPLQLLGHVRRHRRMTLKNWEQSIGAVLARAHDAVSVIVADGEIQTLHGDIPLCD
jgi:hypothetical protein